MRDCSLSAKKKKKKTNSLPSTASPRSRLSAAFGTPAWLLLRQRREAGPKTCATREENEMVFRFLSLDAFFEIDLMGKKRKAFPVSVLCSVLDSESQQLWRARRDPRALDARRRSKQRG